MNTCYIPQGYEPRLSVYEMQRAIEFIKQSFQKNLGSALNLKRVSAPLFVRTDTGLNDNLTGVERPVSFDVPAVGSAECQVVQSLAKWKRWALKEYNFFEGKGLYTDMNAIRRDEELDNVGGGLIFNAKNIIGSDPNNPFEVLDDRTGDVLARANTYDLAVQYAVNMGKSYEYTEDWNRVQWLRNNH